MSIPELIIQIKDIIQNLFKRDKNIYESFKQILPYIQKEYQEFIKIIPQLNEIGMEINIQDELQQLRSLSEAIENKDKILFYDTLNFEVIDTLLLYSEIKRIMEN